MINFFKKLKQQPEILALSLIVLAVVSRWLPHPPNVAPIAAIAIFSGLVLPRRWAMIAPLVALLISDLVLGFYGPVMAAVYGCFGVSVLIGRWAGNKTGWFGLIVATLVSAGLFYLVTNAAVWWFGTMYRHDLAGLGASYLAALPFLRNSLLGDVMYLSLFLSLWGLAGQKLEASVKKVKVRDSLIQAVS